MKRTKELFITIATVALLLGNGAFMNAQITVGDDKAPESFSILELISSNNRGMRLPQIPTTADRNRISDAHGTDREMMGLEIFNMETRCVETWNGMAWISVCVSYTVTYNANGGTSGTQTAESVVTNGHPTIPAGTTPSKTGYTFVGWATANNAATADFTTSYTITDNITVYAVWNANTYTVTYDANSGTRGTQTTEIVEYGGHPTIPAATTPSKTGRVFAGWATTDNAATADFTTSFTITDNITVYAVWTMRVFPAGAFLYFDSSDNNRLQLGLPGEFPKANMAFTKFGSVVAFDFTGSSWTTGNIRFNPTNSSYSNYVDVPRYNDGLATDWSGGITNVSAATFHNGSNVKKGKGDICKLVGLTAAQVKSMSETEIANYSSGFRLPTQSEVLSYAGGSTLYSITQTSFNWMGSSVNGINYPVSGSNPSIFLPGTGGYNNAGTAQTTIYGYYWTSTPYSSANAYQLFFDNGNLYTTSNQSQSYGDAVRCVAQ